MFLCLSLQMAGTVCVCVCFVRVCDTMGGGGNADTVYITSFIVIEET